MSHLDFNLSESQYEDLLRDYDSEVKMKKLIEKYQLTLIPKKIHELIDPAVTESICPYCGTNLVLRKRKREPISYSNPLTCLKCKHIEYNAGFCTCEGCTQRRIQESNIAKEKIIQKFKSKYPTPDIDVIDFFTLDVSERAWIIALYISTKHDRDVANNGNFIKPFPHEKGTSEQIDYLLKKGIYKLSGNLSSAIVMDNYNSGYVDILKIDLRSNFNIDESEIYSLFIKKQVFTDNEIKQLQELNKDLFLAELYELLEYNCNGIKCDFTPGEKTELVLKAYADKFTYNQISGIFYSSGNYTRRVADDNGYSRRRKYNLYISNLEKRLFKIIQEDQEIKETFRPKECPITAMRFILDLYLK